MRYYCVLIADRGRARFFTMDATESGDASGGPDLVEQADLTNPEKRLPQTDLFAENKPGAGRETQGGPVHGYDDHRDGYEAETDRKFAREVVERTAKMVSERKCSTVVIASPSQMLGLLREYEEILARSNVNIEVLPKNITKLSLKEIHEHLAKENLIPPRRKPSFQAVKNA